MTAAFNPSSQRTPLQSASLPTAHGTAPLWERYRTAGDEDARQELLRLHVSLVHFVARQMSSKTTAVEYEELVSAGALGLLAALKGYDPSRGFAFATYAVTRIRGAILDELRQRDWMPRSSRRRSRELGAARARLQGQLLRQPTAREVASELGLDLEHYWRWCDELDVPGDCPVTSQKDLGACPEADRPTVQETTEDQLPDQHLVAEEERAKVRTAIQRLPERQQQVLALCFFEELTLREAGAVLGVTESRVSQMRKQALQRLAGVLRAETSF
ncbi:MAG TPA: FliA/WhiG family RNA polymerase sigma factor [Gemmatimonadales bacterium]|nr:FliA/WhiG family RNA polymerase sigma factor [Gemmatimonadales bacterium]